MIKALVKSFLVPSKSKRKFIKYLDLLISIHLFHSIPLNIYSLR